jgi:hypothetical protein
MTGSERMKNRALRNVRRLFHAQADIHSARELTEHLLANAATLEKSYARRAMQDGIIIAYARPFGENDGLGSLPQEFREFERAEAKALHEKILSARDLIAAHNNILDRNFLLSREAIEAEPHKVKIFVAQDGQTMWEVQTPSLNATILQQVRELCLLQESRINRAASEIIAELARNRTYEPGAYVLGENFP